MPSPVRFAEIERLFKAHGWSLARINGSHHIFKSPTGEIFPVTVHKGLVKYGYLREVKKRVGES